jgi:hypothetical protein
MASIHQQHLNSRNMRAMPLWRVFAHFTDWSAGPKKDSV